MRLADKTVVITGAGRGLGRAGARLFAREGATVVIGDVDEESMNRTVGEIEGEGGTAIGVPCDVTDEGQVKALVETASERFGRLDVMWNNAGIALQGAPDLKFEDLPSEAWHRQVAVNLTGVYYGCKHAVAPMKAQGQGTIIITSSAGAFASAKGWSMYSIVKGGVNAMVMALAVDLGGYGIRVNGLAPTGGMGPGFLKGPGGRPVDEDEWEAERAGKWVRSESAPHIPLAMDRPPMLSDHAHLALFLASDESAYMSGQVIVMDGARLSQMAPYLGPRPS